MDKCKINYAIDIGLIISFLVVFITGVIKLRVLSSIFSGLIDAVTPRTMAFIHDWSGVAMGVLVFLHIVCTWDSFTAMTRKYFGKKKLKQNKFNIKSKNL